MKTINLFKTLGLLIVLIAFSTQGNAQQTTGDVTKETGIDYGTTTTGGSIRVIDNKGTIKYLQVKNGLTILSNTTADVTTTTWQLGGVLTEDVFIDVDTQLFGLDGLTLETGTASTDAINQSDAGTGTGWTVLVRDEATGATRKTLATNLISSGHEIFTATASQTTYGLAVTTEVLNTFSKVWVYRNGAKLLSGVDYTVATNDNNVELVPSPGTGVSDWSVLVGDIIEVQYYK